MTAMQSLLLSQVRNTAPYLWDLKIKNLSPAWLQPLFIAENQEFAEDSVDNYRFQLVCHWATVATYVPTDVDSKIRSKLWKPQLGTEVFRAFAQVIHEARLWPVHEVTRRGTLTPFATKEAHPQILSGHWGEWFTVAAAAYCALRKRDPETAQGIRTQIEADILLHEQCLAQSWDANDAQLFSKISYNCAHNFGDLDRVLDLWNLPVDDELRISSYKVMHPSTASQSTVVQRRELWMAAQQVNDECMAPENGRHFALRRPKSLRRRFEYQLPLSPFLEDWGIALSQSVRDGNLGERELGEIVEALIDGFFFKDLFPQAYARALLGVESNYPSGPRGVHALLPSREAKRLQAGVLRTQIGISRERFEQGWSQRVERIWEKAHRASYGSARKKILPNILSEGRRL